MGEKTRLSPAAHQKHNRKRDKKEGGLPSSEAFPTSIPSTGKRLFFGVCSLMSLHMLNSSNSKIQLGKPRSAESYMIIMNRSHLNHLLQYLQGKVLGFCCLTSPFASVFPDGGPCGDCMESILLDQASVRYATRLWGGGEGIRAQMISRYAVWGFSQTTL